MRHLFVQVPQGQGRRALTALERHHAMNAALMSAATGQGGVELVLGAVPNRSVGALLEELEPIDGLRVTLVPRGVLALQPPPEEAPQQVLDVQDRSPVEVLLAGLQSVGSWKGFLGYAVLGGAVAWVGLLTGSVFLLIASMLIAPFAGPAVNAALATARGDGQLLRRTVVRYVAAIATTIATAALLTLLLGPETPTEEMLSTVQVSSVAVLLPLAGGAAGALQLVQSERSSLVSGAAVGLLVAAALAPPAGVVGMATILGEWALVTNAGFLLVLQLLGINLAGALVFRAFGQTPVGARYGRGRRTVTPLVLGVNLAALAALVVFQLLSPVTLQRGSLVRGAETVVAEAVTGTQAVLIEADVRLTGPSDQGRDVLLADVLVRPAPGGGCRVPEMALRRRLERRLSAWLPAEQPLPLVQLTVVDPAT